MTIDEKLAAAIETAEKAQFYEPIKMLPERLAMLLRAYQQARKALRPFAFPLYEYSLDHAPRKLPFSDDEILTAGRALEQDPFSEPK